MPKSAKCYPDSYSIADFPSGKNPEPGTAELWRSPSGWAERRSDGKVYQLCLAIESTKAPTVADLDTPWSIWWHYDWDMLNLKAVVWKYERSPISNDVFPPLNSMGQIDIVLTPTDLTNGNKQVELPQGATFEYIVTRTGGAINQLTFAAGTFSGASSYYMDAAKTVLRTGARAHSFASTQVAAGLGIIADAPSNAKFVRYEFQYVSGGKLTYDFAI